MGIEDDIQWPFTGTYKGDQEIKRKKYGKEEKVFVDGKEYRASGADDEPAPLFVKGEGMDVQEVASRLLQYGPLAHLSGWFWEYKGGVYVAGWDKRDIVSRRMCWLLGAKYRSTQVPSVSDMLLSMEASVPRLTGELLYGCVNWTNGMLSTEDLQLYPHDPKYMSTCQYQVPWQEMDTPYFDEWVEQVNEPDAIDYFLQVFGYLLVPGNDRQTAVFVKGSGANGKSTWFRIIEEIVGKHNISHVSLQQMTDNRFAGADLFGKVLNIVGDIGSAFIEDTSFFKKVTGQDEVRAERKNAQPFEFTPYCVPVFSGNLIPPSNDPTHGYKRRWTHISFPNQFEPSPDYEVRFESEYPGIAYKAVMAYLNLKGQDFIIPASALKLKKEFDQKSDHVMKFIEDLYDFGEDNKEPWGAVPSAYRTWCDEEGIRNPLKKSDLQARLLSDPRITKVRVKGYDFFKGITRKSAFNPDIDFKTVTEIPD